MRIPKRRVSNVLVWFLISTLLLACVVQPVQAQTKSIRFETLSVDDGLSHSIVRTIAQDIQGFMWFGTDDGLNKYDGYSFTVYKHNPEQPESISDNTIYTMYRDLSGDLWVGTGAGLDRLISQEDFFEHYPLNPDNPISGGVTAIAEDRLGNLWIGTSNQGLNLFNRKAGSFTRFPIVGDGESNKQVNALASDQRGGLWIGTTEGLNYYDPQTRSFTHYRHNPRDSRSLGSDQINALFLDRFGILWIGTEDNGLNRYNPSTQEFTRYIPNTRESSSINSTNIHTIFEDQSGQLWIGGRNGISIYSRESDSFIRYQRVAGDPYSLGNDYVLSIYADTTGVLWVGTYGGGVSKYVPATERFSLSQNQPSVASSLSNDIIYAIYEDSSGVVWIGSLDSGLNRLDPETGNISTYRHSLSDFSSLGNNDVRAILEDQSGALWIGTYGGGVNRMELRTGRFTRYIHNNNNPNSLSDSRVTSLVEDQNGNLWIGTYNGGLDRLNRETGEFAHFRYSTQDPESIGSDTIYTIYEDREGMLWVGTNEGISVLNPGTGKFTHYTNDPSDPTSLSHNRVSAFYEALDGTMWVGTLIGGLNRFDRSSKKFQRYTQENGLPNNSICGILADSSGYLWMSTNWGLSRFDPSTETFRNYDRRDGLQNNEFSPGAYFQNNQGWMYFGGVQGFNTFDPSRVQDNPVAPPVAITAFKKFNQIEKIDLSGSEPVKLSYQDNFISFEFAALDYAAPEKNQYAYKLEGFNKDWVEAGTRRYASYTNLRGGTYVFHVIGSNPDGVWNNTGASITLIITPPIWERWWFIASSIVLLVGSGVGAYWLRITSIQGRNRELERQVGERTQEIERRREVAEGLREILTILNTNHTLKESLDAIIVQITRLMETRGVVIFRCGENNFPIVLATNLEDQLILTNGKRTALVPSWIINRVIQGETLVCPDMTEYARVLPEVTDTIYGSYRSLLAVPLIVNDTHDGGLILLYNYQKELNEEDKQNAKSFADHAALAIANAELRNQAEEIAVSAERNRLARDLHDAVTQTLFATSLIAEVLPRLWDRNPEIGKQKTGEIRELTRGALAEMRTLLMELRPAALEDVPLPDLLQQLSEAFTGRARIPVEQYIDKSIVLPSQVKTSYYRITQEALNNIQKHSRATRTTVELCETKSQVRLCISDNGIGFDPEKTSPDHFGLGIMEERAQSIGAQLMINSRMGEGTQVELTWTRAE